MMCFKISSQLTGLISRRRLLFSRSSDQSSSSFMLLTCCSWWSHMVFIHTAMQMTLRRHPVFCNLLDVDTLQKFCRSALTSFHLDDVQLAAAYACQDWGALVFICSSSASDPDGSCSYWYTSVLPVRTVRDLGVYIDANVTMSARVTAVVKACFAALQQIHSVLRLLTRTTFLSVVLALVVTKVDYCNSVLSGISAVFRTTVTTAAVCVQHCHSSHVLGEEVRAHNSTPPWTTLAESSGENSVPVICSRVSLP